MKPEEVKHDIAYRKQFAPKPAEPVTDAGKALMAFLIADGLPEINVLNSLLAIETEAQDLILSDVEGLARALVNVVGEYPLRHELGDGDGTAVAGEILAAWRQERQ